MVSIPSTTIGLLFDSIAIMPEPTTFADSPVERPNSVEKGHNALTPDEALLASLGYKQEFRREFSKLEVFGVSFSIIGVVPSVT